MDTFYERQHPSHTEDRRQALRDAATHNHAIGMARRGDDTPPSRPLSVMERRRVLAAITEQRAAADEMQVDPLGMPRDPLAPRGLPSTFWRDFAQNGGAWALSLVLLATILIAIRPWPW